MSTIFCAAANAAYEHFVIPWLFSVLRSNSQSAVEILVEDAQAFRATNRNALLRIQSWYGGDRLHIRDAQWKGIVPNTVRFVESPELCAEFRYFGDIDLLIFDSDVEDQHRRSMQETGLPYSNFVRPGLRKLTGLHFTRHDAYYPLPDISDIDLARTNDEEVLYEIVERRVGQFPSNAFRPLHGIHFSPNRPQIASPTEPGWNLTPQYFPQLLRMLESQEWQELQPSLDARFVAYLNRALNFAYSRSEISGELASDMRIFEKIASTNMWGSGESVSGPGSTFAATAYLRPRLRDSFKNRGIESLIDAPCGDCNWIVDISSALEMYMGFDCVPEVIMRNLQYIRQSNHFFRIADIVRETLPRADAILCRDCLVHLPNDAVWEALRRFKRSGSTWLYTTTFTGDRVNDDIQPGNWRPINLCVPPFSLPPPSEVIRERKDNPNDPSSDKSIGVWHLPTLSRLEGALSPRD